jgi:hypothetical protein
MSEELSSQVPLYSTKGDLSDIEDQAEVFSEFLFYNVSNQQRFKTNSRFIVSFGCIPSPTALFRSATMTIYVPTSTEINLEDGCKVHVAAQPKSTYATDGTNCSVLSYVGGEQLSDILFQSTEGEISDIEEPRSSSTISGSAFLPITNATTPTFGSRIVLSSPTAILSLSQNYLPLFCFEREPVVSMENVSECFLSLFYDSFWPIILWLSPLLLLLSLSECLAMAGIGSNLCSVPYHHGSGNYLLV